MKPIQTLGFLSATALVLGLLLLVMPKSEIQLGSEFAFRYPTWESFWLGDTVQKKSMEDINAVFAADTVLEERPGRTLADSIRRANLFLQYPNGDKSILAAFFEALNNPPTKGPAIRVLHFGDSQIEGERMTAYIRAQMQARFGGSGPGMIPIIPVAPFMSVKQSQSDNWRRFTLFGQRDPSVKHKRYGPLANFARFAPIADSSHLDSTQTLEAWLRIDKSSSAYARGGQFTHLRLFYSGSRLPVQTLLLSEGALVRSDSLKTGRRLSIFHHHFSQTPNEVTLNFSGADSPDFFALSLEGEGGVVVDNISMRGSSGTVFTEMDGGILRQSLDSLNVKLFLLQYGGNTVPYIESKKEAFNYAQEFKKQINYLKKLVPDACVIVIGPSDMATKEGTNWVTYPHLPDVRDALKQASFEAGAAYFDIFEVMGGLNSMPAWVSANPPLAGPDYIHFTPEGAKRVATQFYKALIRDFEEFRLHGPAAPVAKSSPSKPGLKPASPSPKAPKAS